MAEINFISIVICTRNRAMSLDKILYFYKNIETCFPWELIFVDNNSTDNTMEVLAGYLSSLPNLRILHNERTGLGAARDFAWRHAQGDIVIFTDDDCYPSVDFIDRYVDIFSDETIDYAGSRILLWDDSDAMITVDYREQRIIYEPYKFIPAGSLHGANLAVRQTALREVDGFDALLGAGTPFPCEDIDLIGRLSYAGFKGCFDPRVIIYHHHGRKTDDIPKLMKSYDAGRGAYYIKMLFIPKARKKLLQYLIKRNLKNTFRTPGYIITIYREFKSAFQFLKATRQHNEH